MKNIKIIKYFDYDRPYIVIEVKSSIESNKSTSSILYINELNFQSIFCTLLYFETSINRTILESLLVMARKIKAYRLKNEKN